MSLIFGHELMLLPGITQLFRYLEPGFDTSRVCIKIPSTWEGMIACRSLELAGVRTLATTLFTFAQAVLAAEVGCTYVAPYVNQLKVHFEPGSVVQFLSKMKCHLLITIQFYRREQAFAIVCRHSALLQVDPSQNSSSTGEFNLYRGDILSSRDRSYYDCSGSPRAIIETQF